MSFRVSQPNFSRGEIAEELVARHDVASYATSLRTARNVIVMKYGGVTKRPGTRLVSEVYEDNGVRLIPFQFSLSQTYALEMGHGYMRAASSGGLVIEDRLTITAIVLGETTQISAAFHGYEIGDQIYFQDIAGTVELNGKVGRVVSIEDAGRFSVDIDSRAFTAFSGDAGGTVRSSPPAPPPAAPVIPPPAPDPTPPDLGGWNGGGGFFGWYQ